MATSTDLFADIWGSPEKTGNDASSSAPQPATTTPSRSPTPTKRSRPTSRLFHSDDDQSDVERQPIPKKKKTALAELPPELDAMFPADDDDGAAGGNDDFNFDFTPMVDVQQLAKEAEARHARTLPQTQRSKAAQQGTTSKNPLELVHSDPEDAVETGKAKGDTPKKRKEIPKLNETRLLGEYGFTALLPNAKKFKPKGKGHEAADLARLLEMYQLWGHRMFPKMQFRDTVERVEKLCHSRAMTTSLSIWRDEYKHGPRKPEGDFDDPIGVDSDSDGDEAQQQPPATIASTAPASSSSQATSPAARHSEVDDADMDDLMADLERTAGKAQASSTALDDVDNDEMWDMADEMAASMPTSKAAPRPPPSDFDHDDMWDVADELEAAAAPPPKAVSKPAAAAVDDEAALWEGMGDDDEILASAVQDAPSGPSASSAANNATGEDSMDVDATGDAALKKRRLSMQEEFNEGWDDMYD